MNSATTPTEQQFYDALSPDLKRKVDEARALKAGAREELAKASQDKLNTIRVRFTITLPRLNLCVDFKPPVTDRKFDAMQEQARSEAPVWADAAPQDPKAKR